MIRQIGRFLFHEGGVFCTRRLERLFLKKGGGLCERKLMRWGLGIGATTAGWTTYNLLTAVSNTFSSPIFQAIIAMIILSTLVALSATLIEFFKRKK